jgi:hypothetical protein
MLAAATAVGGPRLAWGRSDAESLARALRDSLTPAQQRDLVLPWDDGRRTHAGNNWHVVRETIGRAYTPDQRQVIEDIVQSLTSEDGHERLTRSMRDDAGGLDNYSAAMFDDGSGRLAFVLTGRHLTMRADSGAEDGVFGGPVFYGHAVEFNERPDHPGNVWWTQARAASKIYYALDARDRERALVDGRSPRDDESSVRLHGGPAFTGARVGDFADDQRDLVADVVDEMLAPYREADAEAVRKVIDGRGGIDQLHLTFYGDGDLPDEHGVWDRWKIEGPGLAWYFRGSPHVHAWLHVGSAVS